MFSTVICWLGVFIFTLLVALTPIELNAQSGSDRPVSAHPSILHRYSIKRLAKKLTRSYVSEEEKAKAIYAWMTLHIRQDIKLNKHTLGNSSKPKKVLRRGKGSTYEIAMLYASLCREAGLRAYVIAGYNKGYWHKNEDPFYYSTSAWNGVLIHGEWKLVDVAQGAGVVVQRKRTVRKVLFRTLAIPYTKNKLKFKRQSTYAFFDLMPEHLFVKSLPTDPAWQLRNCPIPQVYFEQRPTVAPFVPPAQNKVDCMSYRDTLQQHFSIPISEWDFKSAVRSFKANPRYHFSIALGHKQLADSTLLHALDVPFEHADEKQVVQCSTAIAHYEKALQHYVANKDSLKTRHRFETRRAQSRIKNLVKTNKGINKDYINTWENNKEVIGSMGLRRRILKHRNRSLKRQNKKLQTEDIDKVRRSNSPPSADKLKKIKMNMDLVEGNFNLIINNRDSSINLYEDSIRSTRAVIRENEQVILRNLKTNLGLLAFNVAMRIEYDQNLDTIIFPNQATYQFLKAFNDSLRTFNEKLEKTTIRNNRKRIGENYRINVKLIRQNKRLVMKSKRMSHEDKGEDDLFKEQSQKMIQENEQNIQRNELKLEDLEQEKELLKKENKLIKKHRRLLRKDISIENKRYKATTKHLNKGFKVRAKTNSIALSDCKSRSRQAQKRLKAIEKVMKAEVEKLKKQL